MLMLMSFYNDSPIYRRFYPAIFLGLTGFGQTSPLSGYHYLLMKVVLRLAEPYHRLLIFFSIDPCLFQLEHIVSGFSYQSARDKEDSVSYDLDGILYFLLVQYLFLEEVHKIVGEHQELKPGIVAGVAVRDHLIQSKAIYPFFDEVFTTGPFVVIPPDIHRLFFTVGHDHLIVIFHIPGIEEFQLFLGGVLALYPLPYKNHSQADTFVKDIFTLPCVNPTSYICPVLQVSDLLLNPWLDRDNDVKFNGFVDQKPDHLPAEEAPICPKPYILHMRGKCLDDPFEKLNGMIRCMMLSASEKTSQIISGLTYKAQKRMIALSSLLLGVVPKPGPLLIPVNRGDVRIQIQGNAFKCLKATSELHEKIKVKASNLSGNTNLQGIEKTADGRLNRKRHKPRNPLKYSVSGENLHLSRSRITQKHSIQTTHQHITNAVLTLSSTYYPYPTFNLLLYPVALKESPYKTASTKSGEILATELFFDPFNLLIAFAGFLSYILFHFLSASSIVLGICWITLYYYRWRHFSLKT
jgi:hypothetical protein